MTPHGNIFIHQFAISDLQIRQILQAIISKHQPESRLAMQSNGWSSPKMNHSISKSWPLGYFVERIKNMMSDVAGSDHPLRYWFVCVNQGGNIGWHDHSQADWAGVFYPHTPEKDCGGQIMFESGEVIQPKAGLFVAFPGTLSHKVMPYKGSTARYSVAFNRDPQAHE